MATYRHDPEARWFAAIRGGVILVLEAGASSELTAIWPELGAADPTPLVLDRLTAKGLAATPSFALVVRDDAAGTARVVVRGPIGVRAGADEIHDPGVSTWVERVLDGARAIEIVTGVETDASTTGLPVVEAVVAASSIVSEGIELVAPARPAPQFAATPAAAPVASAAVAAPEASAVVPAPEASARPEPAPFAPASAAPVRITAPVEFTMIPDEETVASAASSAGSIPSAAPSPSPSLGEIDGDHDGMTVANVDIRRLREERAARGPAAPLEAPTGATPAAPTAQASIRMPDGTLEPIGHEVVLGRAPSVSKVSGGRIPRLVTIGLGDPDISRSHVRLALEGDTVVITDLHSRNGTHVVAPGRAPVKLRSGEPTPVLTGTVVDLGGGWTIQVVGG